MAQISGNDPLHLAARRSRSRPSIRSSVSPPQPRSSTPPSSPADSRRPTTDPRGRHDAKVPLLDLSAELAGESRGPEGDPDNPPCREVGRNDFKDRMRSQRGVAARHDPDLPRDAPHETDPDLNGRTSRSGQASRAQGMNGGAGHALPQTAAKGFVFGHDTRRVADLLEQTPPRTTALRRASRVIGWNVSARFLLTA